MKIIEAKLLIVMKMNKNKEILDVLEEKHEIILGKCPHCNSTNYLRENPDFQEDDVIVNCNCNDCEKTFREYFVLDEVLFHDEDKEEFIYNKTLSFHDKKILLKAMNLMIEYFEDNPKDYTKIINILKNKLNRNE